MERASKGRRALTVFSHSEVPRVPIVDDRVGAGRSTPQGMFGALIRCECGHGIGAHTRAGCSVGIYAACACRLSDAVALTRAIERATKSSGNRRPTDTGGKTTPQSVT